MSVEASGMVTMPRGRTELETSLRAEVKRLRREAGRNVAKARIEADPGPGGDAPTFSREKLAEAWGLGE